MFSFSTSFSIMLEEARGKEQYGKSNFGSQSIRLFPFPFRLSPGAAIAAALPSAAVAGIAAKPPMSRRRLRLLTAGSARFPPFSRRFPLAWPPQLRRRKREIQLFRYDLFFPFAFLLFPFTYRSNTATASM
jgi:hypothetical protein